MHSQPFLVHLADRFTPQPENLATEPSAYVPSRSLPEHALLRLPRSFGADLPDDVTRRTQLAPDDQAARIWLRSTPRHAKRLIVATRRQA